MAGVGHVLAVPISQAVHTHPQPPILMTLESLSYAAQVLEGTFPE